MKIITEIPVRQDIVVDVVESHLEVAYANQYDDNTSTIWCHIQNKGVDFNVEDYTATLRVKKSNGKGFSANIGSKDLEGTVQGNVVSFKIPRYLTVSHGKQICNLEFYEKDHVEDGIKYSCTFYLRVNKNALQEEDILDSDYYVSVHDEYVKLKTDMTDALAQEQERATQAENTISDNLAAHSTNKDNPHDVTKNQLGLSNVENKSSAAIRQEITKANVTDALGYTPYTPNEVDNKLSALETNKVDKIDGKGLSANDFTDDYKSTLDNISENKLASIKTEITELKKSVSDGKSAVASAITGMGVSTAADDTFDTMAGNVEKIKPTINVGGSVSGSWNGATFNYGGGGGGSASINGKNTVSTSTSFSGKSTTVGGNATASDVLSGKTFSSNNAGREVNGTMTNQGAYTADIRCLSSNGVTDYSGIKITIPAGYHNGSGYIRAHSNSAFCFCKTHKYNSYNYTTISPTTGYYYAIDGVSEATTSPLFVVLWEGTAFTKVLDIMFVGDGWGNRYISYTGDFSCWRNGSSVVINKDSANKISDGIYMSAIILSFVGR